MHSFRIFMENWIISRKQISLEKNREFSFKIPVLINPSECEFEIERTDIDSEQETNIVFLLRRTKTGAENEKAQVSVSVINKTTATRINGQDLNGEFLLLSCTADKNIQFAFSIRRHFTRNI